MYGVGLRVVGEAEGEGIAAAGERKRCGNGAFADTGNTHERQRYSAVLLNRFRTHATSLSRSFTYAFRPAGLTSMQSYSLSQISHVSISLAFHYSSQVCARCKQYKIDMLKSMSESNYSSLLWLPPSRLSTRPNFYNLSNAKNRPQKFPVAGYDYIQSSEFKSASLGARATEICVLGMENKSPTQPTLRWGSFPYFFEASEVYLDEHDKTSDYYLELIVHEYVLQGEDRAFLPFPTERKPQLAVLVEKANYPVRCLWNSDDVTVKGFYRKSKFIKVRDEVFFSFGGILNSEVQGGLSVIALNQLGESRTNYACKPTIRGILPSPRRRFSWCNYKSCVYLFGGCDNEGYLSDLWKLSLVGLTCTSSGTAAEVQSTQILTVGGVPRARGLFCSVGDSLYIFAGKGPSGFDVPIMSLDMHTLIWSKANYPDLKLADSSGKMKLAGCKGPLIIFARLVNSHEEQWDLHIFDTNLHWASVVDIGLNLRALTMLPGDLMCNDEGVMMRLAMGGHYSCSPIPKPLPALARLLGTVFDKALLADAEIVFQSGERMKVLRSCLAARGSEGAQVLSLTFSADPVSSFTSPSVFRCAVRYLYTDLITIPQLPVAGSNDLLLTNELEFLQELMACASSYGMSNLRNLCILGITQSASIESSLANLYSDCHRLSILTADLPLGRVGSLDSAHIEILQPDYLLLCTDGDVPMHKFILFLQSSLFRTVFTGGFESDQEEFRVDYSVQVVSLAKMFMYTDSVEVKTELLVDTMRLAAFLGVKALFVHCQRQVALEINYSNFLAMYDLSLQLNASLLQTYCEEMYEHCCLWSIRQYENFLQETPELQQLSKLHSAKKITPKALEKMSEADRMAAIEEYTRSHPDPEPPNTSKLKPPAYYDPLPDFLADVETLQNVDLRPPHSDLHLSRNVSLEDEHWERHNRFVLSSSSESSDSDS